jgi:hypothetical protein
MKKHLVRLAATAGVAAALVVGVAAPAWATATVSSSGGSANYNSTTNVMSVSDTACDSRYQYVWFNWGTSTSTSTAARIENHGGCNSTLPVTLTPGGNSQITFQTCTEIPSGPDNCSGWVTTPA